MHDVSRFFAAGVAVMFFVGLGAATMPGHETVVSRISGADLAPERDPSNSKAAAAAGILTPEMVMASLR